MSYKAITVLLYGRDDPHTLSAAAWLAAEHGARLTATPVYPDPASDLIAAGAALGAAIPQSTYDEMAELNQEIQAGLEKACRKACAEADIAYGAGEGAPRLILEDLNPIVWTALERACTLTDLVVVGRGFVKAMPQRAMQVLEDVLMRLRVPLLVVSRGVGDLTGPVAIAWNGRLEAARAVKGAMPLIAGGSQTLILQHPSVSVVEALGPEVLADYLESHELGGSDLVYFGGDDAGDALLQEARRRNVGLLVAGAYGHSRLRELVLGGVTRSLLFADEAPSLLLAH
ncbi:universal stress protein [Brevundimonas sp. 2R-24]|uniref:Universal stress protein n=1 Tax=Peiella sedimenti TaxID=3061083 RepID=A0ABT8SLU0_9CAUL|nr:universal stress protein [Caulobacteraceae bacterium XZ-24]